MSERLRILKSDIQVELAAIEHIFEALPTGAVDLGDIKEAIVVGYYLHNLYNAFESIFRLVAEVFENHVPDAAQWHSLLLERMGRDIADIRPRLLSEGAVDSLDELRRFRHLFRHMYRYDLKPPGVQQALQQAHHLRSVYRADVERFIGFLDLLQKENVDDALSNLE